jgi:hypothetical protein
LQVPGVENGEVAIARAVVRTEEGKFSGIGDASPGNVSRAIVPHIIRMAETRAKARALRDAINVGVAALEELGDEEVAPEPARGETKSVESSRMPESQAGEGKDEVPKEALPATRKQLNYLEALIADVVEDGVPKFETWWVSRCPSLAGEKRASGSAASPGGPRNGARVDGGPGRRGALRG